MEHMYSMVKVFIQWSWSLGGLRPPPPCLSGQPQSNYFIVLGTVAWYSLARLSFYGTILERFLL